MSDPYRSYTAAENRGRVRLAAQAVRRGVAGAPMGDLEQRRDRINDRAEDRGYREATAMARELEAARNKAADALTAERVASREDKQAAKEARKEAEKAVTKVEREAKRYGLS